MDEVRYQLNALVRKQLSQRYQAEVLSPQVEVTPEEVERTFVEMGFDRERLFARILVRQQQEVDRVLQALHEGEPFAELAQRFAANDLFAPPRGRRRRLDWAHPSAALCHSRRRPSSPCRSAKSPSHCG